MKGKLQTKQEERLTTRESRRPPEISMAGRRSPTLSGRRGPVQREPNHGTPAGPPSFVLSLKDCEIVEGSAARFQCQVTGNPEPDVEWYKDGRKLRESKQLTFLYDENDNCKLIITEGRQKDAGEYKVVAVNRHGQVSCSAKLIIKEHASSDEESGGEASDSEISDDATDEEKDVGIRTDSITKYYKIKDELGKGRFGVVCKCSRISDGKCFAAKFIKCSKEQDKKDVKHEIEIMSVLRHRRLLRLADAFESPTEIVLVMELVTGGELFEKVVEDEFISENDVIHYMKQIIEGVQHMHSKEVLHLDLKPENIMIVRPASRQIKLIDFGLARKYNPKENLKVMFGTPEFVAPEVLTYDRITPATDMWSIGVIAYVLLSGLSPFMGDNDAETLSNVQTAEWDFDDPVFDDISDDAKEFISKLLVLKATNRITVEKCLKHSWLTVKRETFGKQLKTDRLKAFTARRKWKKALTAIRSTNFLSRLMGSRGSSDGSKKSSGDEGGVGGGGGGLLARVKAMHSAGVQAPGSGPSSSPFLSPSSAEKAKPSAPAETSKSATPSSKSPTTTTAPSVENKEPSAPKSTTPRSKEPTTTTTSSASKKEPSTPSANKTETKDSTKTDSKATPSNNVSKEPKVTDANDVSSKPTESNNNINNKEPEKPTDRTKTSKPTSSPPKTTVNDTKKNSDSPASTRPAKVPTPRKGAPGKLGQVWPPPPKERPQKREIQELVEKYSKSGIPLTADSPEHEYDIKDEIDRGKFAVLKKCVHHEKKKTFAAKLIKFDEDEENETVQEFDVHRSLKHKNLVTLFSAYIVQKYLVLVMELVEGEDALSSLASKYKVTEDDVTNILKPVLDALEYLHKKNILHLDIRPANILVSQDTVKLIDFGCARRLTNKEGEVGAVVGNTEFSAPEMLSFEPVNSSSDMWSLGVTTYLLLSAELPFSGDDDDMVAEAVKTGTILINDDSFPSTTRQAKDFVQKLLSKIPGRRLDAATAKSHDWLSPSFGRERRKIPTTEPRKYKEILDELLSQEEDELISASCVLRTFEEEPYESPEEDDDDEED